MPIPVLDGNRVLVVPLDWGLGHATRCIPIIKQLLEQKKKVMLGGCGSSGTLLKTAFPQIPFIEFPAYAPRYSPKRNMYWSMLFQSPRFFKTIRRENKFVARVIKEHSIDTVISDNRYGLYNKNVYTIFITHQLFIRAGIFSRMVKRINHGYIRKYNQCWVPDYENIAQSLSGELSHGKHALQNV
ncbi:MAG: glycosyltransferase, partial [Flavobacteriales bacterium]